MIYRPEYTKTKPPITLAIMKFSTNMAMPTPIERGSPMLSRF